MAAFQDNRQIVSLNSSKVEARRKLAMLTTRVRRALGMHEKEVRERREKREAKGIGRQPTQKEKALVASVKIMRKQAVWWKRRLAEAKRGLQNDSKEVEEDGESTTKKKSEGVTIHSGFASKLAERARMRRRFRMSSKISGAESTKDGAAEVATAAVDKLAGGQSSGMVRKERSEAVQGSGMARAGQSSGMVSRSEAVSGSSGMVHSHKYSSMSVGDSDDNTLGAKTATALAMAAAQKWRGRTNRRSFEQQRAKEKSSSGMFRSSNEAASGKESTMGLGVGGRNGILEEQEEGEEGKQGDEIVARKDVFGSKDNQEEQELKNYENNAVAVHGSVHKEVVGAYKSQLLLRKVSEVKDVFSSDQGAAAANEMTAGKGLPPILTGEIHDASAHSKSSFASLGGKFGEMWGVIVKLREQRKLEEERKTAAFSNGETTATLGELITPMPPPSHLHSGDNLGSNMEKQLQEVKGTTHQTFGGRRLIIQRDNESEIVKELHSEGLEDRYFEKFGGSREERRNSRSKKMTKDKSGGNGEDRTIEKLEGELRAQISSLTQD